MDPGDGGIGEIVEVEHGMAELYRQAIEDIGEGPSLPALREYRKRHEHFAEELRRLPSVRPPEEPAATFVDAYAERLARGGLRTDVLLTLAEAEDKAAGRSEAAEASAGGEIGEALGSHARAEREQRETLMAFAAQPGMPFSTSGGTF